MTKLEDIKSKALEVMTTQTYNIIDKYVESLDIKGYQKANIWSDVMSGKLFIPGVKSIIMKDISQDEIDKIDLEIKENGTDAILQLITGKTSLPPNLMKHLVRKYAKELSQVKEIVHKKKYSN